MSEQILQELIDQAARERDRATFLKLIDRINFFVKARRPADGHASRHPRLSNMETDTFDIFRGIPDKHARWVEATVGIDQARLRMEELSTTSPNDYFIFHAKSGAVTARTLHARKAKATGQLRHQVA